MRKFTLLVLLIILLILAVSCKKVNLLAPSYIPQETKFLSPPTNAIPKKIDVDPQPAKNGEVFGGFTKKFYYKGEWYVLANYIYYYDATNKTLTQNGNHALLKLDNDGNLMVIGRNLNSYKDGNGITTWTHLGKANIIEDNQIWYQASSFGEYSITNSDAYGSAYNGSKVNVKYQIAMFSNNISYHSSDLLNWNTHGRKDNIAMEFSRYIQGTGLYYYPYYKNVYFKGKLYILGGGRWWTGSPGNRNFPIRIIDWGNNGNDFRNYQSHDYPWGESSWLDVYIHNDRLYVKLLGHHYWKYSHTVGEWYETKTDIYTAEIDYYDSSRQVIYSTTGVYREVTTNTNITYKYVEKKDGSSVSIPITNINVNTNYKIPWQQESSIPRSAQSIPDGYNGSTSRLFGPTNYFHTPTPTPPNWVQWGNNNIYYKSASSYDRISVGGRTYYLPIPPVNEIRETANRGYTNFTITDEHIKNSGKNQFMLSTVNPTNAKNSDWKLITPLEYTGYSMVWQIGADNYLFNLDGKIFQLMDYSQINGFIQKEAEYSSIIKELRQKGEQNREQAEKSTSYSQSYYYNAMYYDAQADILEKIFSKGGYIEPPEAITHYEIEFRNH